MRIWTRWTAPAAALVCASAPLWAIGCRAESPAETAAATPTATATATPVAAEAGREATATAEASPTASNTTGAAGDSGSATAKTGITVSGPVAGRGDELSLPVLDQSAPVQLRSEADLAALWPRAARLAGPDAQTFPFLGAQAFGDGSSQFIVEVTFASADLRQVHVMSWTPVGPIELHLPLSSPTHEVHEFSAHGAEVVTITPSANVVERRGLYRAYILRNGVAHLVDAIDFSEADDFLGLVDRLLTGGTLP